MCRRMKACRCSFGEDGFIIRDWNTRFAFSRKRKKKRGRKHISGNKSIDGIIIQMDQCPHPLPLLPLQGQIPHILSLIFDFFFFFKKNSNSTYCFWQTRSDHDAAMAVIPRCCGRLRMALMRKKSPINSDQLESMSMTRIRQIRGNYFLQDFFQRGLGGGGVRNLHKIGIKAGKLVYRIQTKRGRIQEVEGSNMYRSLHSLSVKRTTDVKKNGRGVTIMDHLQYDE